MLHHIYNDWRERKNYTTKYKLNLKIVNNAIPMEPNPTFLGIKIDPKLCFKPHLIQHGKRIVSKTNLLRRINNFKWANTIKFKAIQVLDKITL